jgi:restriction endonuclease S subunit
MMKRNNWEIVKLKEIAEITMGQSPKSEFYRTKLNSGRFLYYLLQGNIKEITTLGSGSVYDAINKSAIENL